MNRQLSLCCFALCVLGLGCSSSDEQLTEQTQNDRVTDRTPPAGPTDTKAETIIDGMPGPKGQPPSEIRTLTPPIRLVAAGEHWDGGTVWVLLQDKRDAKVVFCVTQYAFESEIKANSLFIGADNANETSARRPLSDDESTLILDSLKSAVESRLNEKLKDFTKKGYDPLEYQNHERFTIPEEEHFSQDQWHVIFAAHALHRLETVEQQELADRDELAKRVAELESVDLESASAKFRSKKSGATRYAEWERLRPVLVAELREKQPSDPRKFLTELLGDGDAEATKRNAGGSDPLEPATDGSVLAYNLVTEGNFYRDLVFVLGEDGGVSFGVASIAVPAPRDDPHDRISEDEKELASKLGAISINLGGGSLDGSYKSGFSLGFKGDEVTDENLKQAAQLTTLVSLYLEGPNVTDERLAILRGHEFLAGLDLISTNATDEGLGHLATLPTLKFLTIEDALITQAGVEHLKKEAPQCKIDWQSAAEKTNTSP